MIVISLINGYLMLVFAMKEGIKKYLLVEVPGIVNGQILEEIMVECNHMI